MKKPGEPEPLVSTIRIKVPGATTVLPKDELSPARIAKLTRKTINDMVAEANQNLTKIYISVKAKGISRAAAHRLSKKAPSSLKKGAEVRSLPQLLTLVVNNVCVFKTHTPLSFDQQNLLKVLERMSGRRLDDLLSYGDFVIYSRIVPAANSHSFEKVNAVKFR